MKYGALGSIVLTIGLAAGCSGTTTFPVVGSPRAVGADGMVTVEEIEGGNKLVTVEVEHLAPPERVDPEARVYVVWFTQEGEVPTKVSMLEYDADGRVGRARATTPLSKFEVVISAEKEMNVKAPSEVIVARRKVHHP